MRVSNIKPGPNVLIETDTDSLRYLTNEQQIKAYIRQFGDVRVVWDNERKIYRVPYLNDRRFAWIKAARKHFAEFHCE